MDTEVEERNSIRLAPWLFPNVASGTFSGARNRPSVPVDTATVSSQGVKIRWDTAVVSENRPDSE